MGRAGGLAEFDVSGNMEDGWASQLVVNRSAMRREGAGRAVARPLSRCIEVAISASRVRSVD
jgi:hypothetical protein